MTTFIIITLAVLLVAAVAFICLLSRRLAEISDIAMKLLHVAETTDAFLAVACNSGDNVIIAAKHPEYQEMLANRLNDMANALQDATGHPRRNVCAETGSRLVKDSEDNG